MDILVASVLLVLSSSTVSGFLLVPAQQQQYTDPWGAANTNPGRQTFPVAQNTATWGGANTNPGRQTFPDSQQYTDPWGTQNTNPGRQTFPVSQPNTDPWGAQNTNPGRQTFPQQQQQPQQQGNQCQTLASSSDCGFYDCFNQVKQQCSSQGQFLVSDMQSLCQGAKQLSASFSSQGKQYLDQVSKCAHSRMAFVVNSQSCNKINFQASATLFGESSGEDCYWQNQLFCNVVSNPQDSQALVSLLFGNTPYNPQFIKVAQHLQTLVQSCSQSAQNSFQNNFANRCPAGTIGGRQNQPAFLTQPAVFPTQPVVFPTRPVGPIFPNQPAVFPTQPMMMMGGAGGD